MKRKKKKVIECPRSMVSYIPDTSNPSVPAKSGCAPLTFLKEDGLPQQVYKEPNSETKCNYQMFRYTSDSREESGQNCFVGDSDILEYDPNKDSACLESDSCASVVCMQAALSAFKERCEHADTICEATPRFGRMFYGTISKWHVIATVKSWTRTIEKCVNSRPKRRRR